MTYISNLIFFVLFAFSHMSMAQENFLLGKCFYNSDVYLDACIFDEIRKNDQIHMGLSVSIFKEDKIEIYAILTNKYFKEIPSQFQKIKERKDVRPVSYVIKGSIISATYSSYDGCEFTSEYKLDENNIYERNVNITGKCLDEGDARGRIFLRDKAKGWQLKKFSNINSAKTITSKKSDVFEHKDERPSDSTVRPIYSLSSKNSILKSDNGTTSLSTLESLIRENIFFWIDRESVKGNPTVTVIIKISGDGVVQGNPKIKISSGLPDFDAAVISAIWKSSPFAMNKFQYKPPHDTEVRISLFDR